MPILTHGNLEILFDGKPIPTVDCAAFTFAREPPEPRAGLGKIGFRGFSATATFELRRGAWEQFRALFEPSKPRWGQPGRRRRRKARIAARRRNEDMQRQRAEALALLARIQAAKAGEILMAKNATERRIFAAALAATENPPRGPLFEVPRGR